MADLFFYGTLRDPDVRRSVMGRDFPTCLAAAPGYRAVPRAGQTYPVLIPSAEGRAEGLVMRNVDRMSLQRLVRYEGREYRLERLGVLLEDGSELAVQAFMTRPGIADAAGGDWLLDDWQKRWKAQLLSRIGSCRKVRRATPRGS
jgi:gamma-glutamylcyclotransferase (GGCT)/AIG2-like uncharacterized protein YtfP